MVSLQAGVIEWIDPWLVRRELASTYTGVRFGLTDPPVQQAFLLQYDSQLQQAVSTYVRQKLPARFAASAYFQAIPPSGRFPIASISTDGFTQIFLPAAGGRVRLSVIPEDELPAMLADAMALPPIDLTLAPTAYANLAIFALIPVPRAGYAALASKLPSTGLNSILPQVLGNRKPIELLRFYQGSAAVTQVSGVDDNTWQQIIGTQAYGFYVRRRSSPPIVSLRVPPPPATTTTTTTTTTPGTTTTAVPVTTNTASAARDYNYYDHDAEARYDYDDNDNDAHADHHYNYDNDAEADYNHDDHHHDYDYGETGNHDHNNNDTETGNHHHAEAGDDGPGSR